MAKWSNTTYAGSAISQPLKGSCGGRMIRHIPNTPPHDVWVSCQSCGADWLGQSFDDECEWCSDISAVLNRSDRQRLIFPEFITWGDSYWELSPIDRTVWATTRGFHGDFLGVWQRKLYRAVADGFITDQLAAKALERYRIWNRTHLPPFVPK